MSDEDEAKIEAANNVLQTFAKETRIERRGNYLYVCWTSYSGSDLHSRRWMTRGQDFYPTWHRHWGHGGTASTALAQLIRWIQGRPVLPLSTWRYWAQDGVKLIRHGDAAGILLEAGYPEHAHCVLCGIQINGGMDWWSLDGVTGPCCGWSSGCRQNPTKKEKVNP